MMPEAILCISGIVFFLLCQGLFAGLEMGMVSLNRIRLRHLSDQGDRRARLTERLLDNPERFLGTTLVSVNLALVAASSVASYLVSLHAVRAPDLISSALMLPLVVIIGELIPKVLYREYALKLTLLTVYLLHFSYLALLPFVAVSTMMAKAIARVFGSDTEGANPYVTREELYLMIREKPQKPGQSKQRLEMAHQTFFFGETQARNVMVPLIDVKAIAKTAPLRMLRDFIAETGFSHIPVYEQRVDQMVGIVELIDLVDANETDAAGDLMREPTIAPETVSIALLFKQLLENKANMAVLIDEFGGASGILTTEDIVEEIVGEIQDEYDRDERIEIVQEQNALIVDGKVSIDKLNEDYDLRIPKQGVETLAGFVISLFGAIPKAGDKVMHQKLEFEVLEATSRAVTRIRVRRR